MPLERAPKAHSAFVSHARRIRLLRSDHVLAALVFMAMPFHILKLSNVLWWRGFKDLASNGKCQELLSFQRQIMKEAAPLEFTDPAPFPSVLKACAAISFRHGRSGNASFVKQGFDSFASVGNSVVDFYAKSGALTCATDAFYRLRTRDSVSWNIIIHGHLVQGAIEKGLALFFDAKTTGFLPNISTLVLIIQACRELRYFDTGRVIHGYVVRSGFWTFASVQNSLLYMYADFGMEFARKLFEEMCDRDVIAWSTIIGGYVQNDEAMFALELFGKMVSVFGIQPDGQIMVTIFRACASLSSIRIGKIIHGFVMCRGLNFDLFVGNSLVDLYSKSDDTESAFRVFSEMPQKNVVSWNSLLSGLVQNGKHSEAFSLFKSMQRAGVEADEITIVNLLRLCKSFLDPYQCKLIHSKVIRKGYESNVIVENSLIDAYAKCNNIGLAWKQFSQVKRRDGITWTTMIAAFTHCGMPDEAILVFQEMNQVKAKPNAVTMLNLIEACSLSAELKKSKWVHGICIRRGLASEVAVGTAILDMYSKCGAIEASRKAFDLIPQKNVVSWTAMIAAYGLNGLPRDALTLHAKMRSQGVKPNPVTTLSVLSACSHGGLVEEGLSFFGNMVQEDGAEIGSEHCSCLVDLLARSGELDTAVNLMNEIPGGLKPGASAWGAILSACRNFRNTEVGSDALYRILELEPSSSSGYLLASNMYAASGLWSDAAMMRWLVKERGVRVLPGYSLVHVNNRACTFFAGDKRRQQLPDELCILIQLLHWGMKIDTATNYRKDDDIALLGIVA